MLSVDAGEIAMPKLLLVVLVLIAAGAGLWFLLREDEAPSPEPEIVRDADTVADDPSAPRLVGAGEIPAAPTVATEGRFAARGRVVDAEGTPLAGIPIEIRTSKSWLGMHGYREVNRYLADTLRTSVTDLLTPQDESPAEVELVSDEAGRFLFQTDVPGQYDFRARVDAPRVSTTATATLIENAFVQQPVVRVLAGTALTGRVIDAHDRPVAAHVEGSFSNRESGRRTFRTTSDATSGTFTVAAVPQGEIVIDVSTKARRYRRVAVVKTPRSEPLIIRLPAGSATLEGLVHTAVGTPIPNALVRVEIEHATSGNAQEGSGKPRKPILRIGAQTGADGTVRLEGLPAGQVRGLAALADGFLRTQLHRGRTWPGIDLPGKQTTTFDLTLGHGSTVKGRVLDGEERPLPGARVSLYYLGWNPPQEQVAITGDDGGYRFAGLGKGKFVLLASHATHYSPQLANALSAQARLSTTRQAPAELSLQLTDEDQVHERDLVLARGGRVTGHVEGPDGRPVPGAAVHVRGYDLAGASLAWGLRSMPMDDKAPAATSGSDGRFAIDGLPPNAEWVLYGKKRGFAGSYTDPVPVEAEQTTDGVVLRLVEQCVLRGRVLDEAGEPIAGQLVFLSSARMELRGGPYGETTDAEGRFEADGLPAASLTLNALRANGQRAGLEVEGLKPGEVREGLVLSFAAGREVSGTIVDQHGTPVVGITVIAQPQDGSGESRQGSTDARGAFRIQNVSAAKVQLQAIRGGRWMPLGDVVEPPATDLRLVLEIPTTVRIEGTVVDPDGEPIPSGRVQAFSADRKGAGAGPATVKDGAFEVDVGGTPPFQVWVSQPTGRDGQPLNLRGVPVVVADPAQPVVIRLEVAFDLRGRVVDEADEPVPGAVIAARGTRTRSDVDGAWHLVGFAPGSITLRVTPPGSFTPPPIVVAAEGQQDVLIRLTQGLSIAGRVVLPEGQALAGGVVTGRWPPRGEHAPGKVEARLSPTGTFRLPGIPPDVRVAVHVRIWSGTAGPTSLAPAVVEDVKPGTDDLVIHAEVGVTLSGIVVDARGAPVTSGQVSARSPAGQGWSQLDGAGRFEMKGLRPGRYEFLITDETGQLACPSQEVTAPAADLRLEIPDLGSLSGRLKGAQPANMWQVKIVEPTSGTAFARGQQTDVAADGTWTLPRVPTPGSWVVVATHKTGADEYARSAPVTAGTEDIQLELQRGESILGRTEKSGRAVPGCWIRVTGAGWQSHGRSDGTGAFVLRGLPPGSYVLTAGSWEIQSQGRREGVATGAIGVIIELDQAYE